LQPPAWQAVSPARAKDRIRERRKNAVHGVSVGKLLSRNESPEMKASKGRKKNDDRD
jgi:hypothetical protein